jgi:hypothetical protein
MLDEGYYDRLGFGTGGYENWIAVDPLDLHPDVRPRPPFCLGMEHVAAIHAARLAPLRQHGAITRRRRPAR